MNSFDELVDRAALADWARMVIQFPELYGVEPQPLPGLTELILPHLTARELILALFASRRGRFDLIWPVIAEIVQEFAAGPEGLELFPVEEVWTGGSRVVQVAELGPVPIRFSAHEEEPLPKLEVTEARCHLTWAWRIPGGVILFGWSESLRRAFFEVVRKKEGKE